MARRVADLVLISGDFASVPQLVAEGRRAVRNLQRVTISDLLGGGESDAPPDEQSHSLMRDQAREFGERLGIDWSRALSDVDQFRRGLEVELEHGRGDPATNVSDDDELTTGKIAWGRLNEFPDYYTRLAKMEAEAERYWGEQVATASAGGPSIILGLPRM